MRCLVLLVLLLPTGCGCMTRHYNLREKEIEYRHQERMRELDIQERKLQQNSDPIAHDAPF